jgi:hypothetical protein
MVEKSRSLSAEELDLIVFLVASLSSSLVMEEACDAIVVEPHPLPLVTCEAVELQSDIVALSPPPLAFVDVRVPVAMFVSLSRAAVALEL